MQNNGSLYLHVVATKHGYSLDPTEREPHTPQYVFSKSKRTEKRRVLQSSNYSYWFLFRVEQV